MFSIFLWYQINIYIHLILIIIIITIIILWESFPASVLCVCPACVFPAGSRGLLKLSQLGKSWNVGKYWERYRRQSGTGGCSHKRITGVIPQDSNVIFILEQRYRRLWQFLTIYIGNVIISVATITKMLLVTRRAKMPLYGVLPLAPIKSRRTAKNAVQRIYIKYGNTKWLELYAVGGQREKALYLYKAIGHFVKSVTSGYKVVIILPLAFPPWWWYYNDDERRNPPEEATHIDNRINPTRNNTLPEKCRIQRTKARENPLLWRWTISG